MAELAALLQCHCHQSSLFSSAARGSCSPASFATVARGAGRQTAETLHTSFADLEELTPPLLSVRVSLSLSFPAGRGVLIPQVFLKEALEQRLEKQREEVRRRAGMVIRAHILSYVAR